MTNENILKYLRENKGKFPQEVLRKKLMEAGYPVDQIEEGIRIVYGGVVPGPAAAAAGKPSFFDFRSVRTYTTFGEKLIDFLAGFFAPGIIGLVMGFLFGNIFSFLLPRSYYYGLGGFFWILPLGIFVAIIFGIFYFWKRRHYFARGLLFCLILPLILIGIGAFLLFFVFGFGKYWF